MYQAGKKLVRPLEEMKRAGEFISRRKVAIEAATELLARKHAEIEQATKLLGAASQDLVWGAAAIGRVVGLSPRQVSYRLALGHLPAKRVGHQWVALRAALLKAVLPDEP